MISKSVSVTQNQATVDRDSLRAGLEETRRRFHTLLDSVTEEVWLRKSPTTSWTVKELFVHLTWALEYLPKEIAAASHGKGMFNLPKRVSDPASYWYIRWSARNSTRESIRRRYDAAMDAAIEVLDSVPDSDWQKGANFYAEGFHTVADLFRAPGKHLEEHTAGL